MTDPLPQPEIETREQMKPNLLGPFLGFVTPTSIKIWLHLEGGISEAYVTVHPFAEESEAVARAEKIIISSGKLSFKREKLWTDCVSITGLKPNTRYIYRLWTNPAYSIPLDLQKLDRNYLKFWTLPSDPNERIDFVLMSCHNPFQSTEDGYEGHAIWADMIQIIAHESNKYVRFAILGGDQVYVDEFKNSLLAEQNDEARVGIYLRAYRKFWGNILYRRVMCSLPAVMIWDDHEIIDGWGSEIQSFEGTTNQFNAQWAGLLRSASVVFSHMQAARNPAPLSASTADGFDCAFRVGQCGFLLLDLRTNRNFRKKQVFTEEQFQRIRQWLRANKKEMRVLFLVSPVVFSHGPHVVEQLANRFWKYVLSAAVLVARFFPWGKGMYARFDESIGDITDDIRDAWSSEVNAAQTDMILDELFSLQNDAEHKVPVVILSGDIHTSGYATIYSNDARHEKSASIPHITSSSVSFKPFNWALEAIYRHASKTVGLGARKAYHAQVSHHFCARSLALLSVRPIGADERQLKVKYYLEGYPEPQILLFDLERNSHRENIDWIAAEEIFPKGAVSPTGVDTEKFLKENNVQEILERKAAAAGQKLNYQESIVDLLKLLNQDSSLGARKKLAEQLGYPDTPDGSFKMNVWLHQEVMRRFIGAGGKVSAEL